MVTPKTWEHVNALYNKIEADYNQNARQYARVQIMEHLDCVNLALQGIEQICNQEKTIKLQEAIDNINKRGVNIKQLIDELNDKFMLFIMGGGKNGKSTVINALLGQDAAKVGIIPLTWKIDVYTKARNEKVILKYNNGTQRQLNTTEASQIMNQEEKKRKVSTKKIDAELKKFRKDGASLPELEEKRAELKKYKLYCSNVTEAVWPVKESPVLEEYRLVDTPGLRQEIDKMTIATAREYYAKADGVIWVLPADKIAGVGDRKEIDDLQKRFGKRTDNVIAIINQIDLIEKEGQSVDDIIAEAQRLYGDVFSEFIPFSALRATQAQQVLRDFKSTAADQKTARQMLESSYLPELTDHLERKLLSHALQIQIDSKSRGSQVLCSEMQVVAKDAEGMLRKMNKERLNRMSRWEKESSELRTILVSEVEGFCDAECKRIRNETASHEDLLWDMASNRRNDYIKSTIIRPEEIEDKLNRMVQGHSVQLEKLTKRHLQAAPFHEFPALKRRAVTFQKENTGILGNTSISGDLSGEENGQAAFGGALAIGAAALLGPVGLALGAIALTDFGKSVGRWLSRTFGDSMVTKVDKQVTGIFKNVKDKIVSNYDEHIANYDVSITDVREKTYAELYGPPTQTEEICALLEQIQDETRVDVKPLTVKKIIFSH